jgi:hypothetical protein
MKKFALVILVFLVLGSSAYFLLRSSGSANPTHALPASTAFYAELPNLPQTLQRWQSSPLALLARDPGVAPFLQRPGQLLRQDSHFETAAALLSDLQLRQLFVALPKIPDTSSPNSAPSFLIGFRAGASTTFQRELLDRLHAEISRSLPESQLATETLDGTEFQKQTLPTGELWTTVAGGWGLVSSDGPALRDFIQGLRQPQAGGTLATAPDFVAARAQLGTDPDLLLYLPAQPWIEALETAGTAAGANPDPAQFALLKSWRAFAYSSTLAGPDSIERKVILAPDLPELGLLQNEALQLAPANTLLYLASCFDTSALTPEFLQQSFGPTLGTLWGESGAAWNELPACLGRETALFLWWPASSLIPSVVARVELADAPRAEQIISGLLGSVTGESLVREEAGLRIHSLPNAGFGLLSPVLAFGPQEALLTLNAADLSTLQSVTTSGENLASAESFRSLNLPNNLQQLGFLDLPALIRRLYLTVQPLLGFAAAMSPDVNRVVDLEKFPAVENVTRHLSPIVATQQPFSGGLLTEIRGPVLLSHFLLGAAAGASEGFQGLPGQSDNSTP